MPLCRIFVACLILTVPALAQFGRGSGGPVASLTQISLNSSDPDAALKFWGDTLGAATFNRDSVKGVSMLGANISYTKRENPGPSAGSAIDHLAMKVPDVRIYTEKLKKTAFKSFEPTGAENTLMIDGPDGLRVELIEDNAMYASMEFSHIHFKTSAPAETQAWYGKFFGARAGTDDQANTSRLQGGSFTFSVADTPTAPTAGRAVDHLMFEIRDMPAFYTTLTAGGVKFDAPYDTAAPPKGTPAFLTDPWGTRIELTGPSGK